MIQIKPIFSDWKEVTKKEALDFARYSYKNITTMQDDEKVEYINKNKLRGIAFTLEQLKGK
jgi:hypothetical protein